MYSVCCHSFMTEKLANVTWFESDSVKKEVYIKKEA